MISIYGIRKLLSSVLRELRYMAHHSLHFLSFNSFLSEGIRISILTVFLSVSLIASSQTYDGYTFYSVQGSTKAYLVDMTGATYHQWTFASGSTTTYSSYLLPGGVVLRAVNHSGNSFTGGPVSGEVQKVDYNGTVLWDYVYSTTSYCSHHDIHPMPNGNVLLIAYERKTATEATQAGCSQSIEMWPEKIVEIQPVGATGGTVVWEWHVWDHLVQQYDPSKNNYGTITAHPELLNINYNTSKDWMHMNGIDYNEALDQIVVSSHNLNEVYVIDHSTTTAQAATHTGGNSGHGGDFLYRWGNPLAYSTTGTVDFNVVHDAHWVPADSPSYPNELCAFNNKGATGSKTCVDIFNPPISGSNYLLTPGTAYAPTTYDWRYTYSGTAQQDMGNSQQLPNGNTLICLAMIGQIIEINPSQTQVWTKSIAGTVAQAFRYPPCYITGTYTATASATNTSLCSGASTQLNVAVTGGAAYTYSWTSTPAGFTSTAQSPTVSPTETTVYNVTVKNGPCSATASVTVTVNPTPSVYATSNPVAICAGSSSQLNAAVTGTTNNTYSWTSSPSGFTSTLQSPTVTPTVSTTYTVNVSSNGCSSSSFASVTVKPMPSVTASSSPSAICAGSSTQLTSTPSGGTTYTYSWTSTPAGFTSTLQNPVVSPNVNTSYSVAVTSQGCTSSNSTAVTVSTPITVSVSANPQTVNLGQSSQLTSTVSGGSSYTYSWTSPSGFTSTLANPVVTPSSTTTYNLQTSSGACSANNSVTVTQSGVPATLQVTPSIQTSAYTAGSISFNVASNSLWTVSSDQSWCSVPSSGTGNGLLTAVLTENTSSVARTATITVNASTVSPVTVSITQDGANKTLALTLFLEGYYNGSGMNKAQNESGAQFAGNTADLATLELHSSTAPYSVVAGPYSVALATNGTATLSLPASYNGNYYIVVKHRNSLETWSGSPVSFSTPLVSYNFTDAAAKAFGSNMREVAGVFVMYSGDINQDGIVDSGDMIPLDNDATSFAAGYLGTDVNGDGISDSSDMIFVDNNSTQFITKVSPE